MTVAQTNEVVVLLANDAMEAAGKSAPVAAILLVDAAATIVVSKLDKPGAREMAGHLAGYIIEQIVKATEQLR